MNIEWLLVGIVGFEPTMTESKSVVLTAWLYPNIKADYENWTHTHKPTTMRTLCLHIVLSVLPDNTERKLKNKLSKGLTSFGVPDGIWTHDPSIKSALLYHLSYEYKFY